MTLYVCTRRLPTHAGWVHAVAAHTPLAPAAPNPPRGSPAVCCNLTVTDCIGTYGERMFPLACLLPVCLPLCLPASLPARLRACLPPRPPPRTPYHARARTPFRQPPHAPPVRQSLNGDRRPAGADWQTGCFGCPSSQPPLHRSRVVSIDLSRRRWQVRACGCVVRRPTVACGPWWREQQAPLAWRPVPLACTPPRQGGLWWHGLAADACCAAPLFLLSNPKK